MRWQHANLGKLERWLPILELEAGRGQFLLRGHVKARPGLGLPALACNLNRLTNRHGAKIMQDPLA